MKDTKSILIGIVFDYLIFQMTIHLALFFFVVAVCYLVSVFWAFKNKREGFLLGAVIGLATVVCFVLDVLLVGKEVDFMLLAMGLLLLVTGVVGAKELNTEANTQIS